MAVIYAGEFNASSGTGPSIPSASNRILLAICAEGYVEGFSEYTAAIFGGQSADSEIYSDRPQATNHGVQVWRWNEAKIAAMSGTAFSFTGGTHGFREVITFVWITEVNQTTLEKDQGGNNTSSLTLNTTIEENDVVLQILSARPNGSAASISLTTTDYTTGFPSGGDDGWDADNVSLASVGLAIADGLSVGTSQTLTSSLTNVDVGCHFAVAYETDAGGGAEPPGTIQTVVTKLNDIQ